MCHEEKVHFQRRYLTVQNVFYSADVSFSQVLLCLITVAMISKYRVDSHLYFAASTAGGLSAQVKYCFIIFQSSQHLEESVIPVNKIHIFLFNVFVFPETTGKEFYCTPHSGELGHRAIYCMFSWYCSLLIRMRCITSYCKSVFAHLEQEKWESESIVLK